MPVEAAPASTLEAIPSRLRLPHLLALLAPLVLGCAVRLANLHNQILLGDELHAVRAALSQTLRQCLTTFRVADNCIPLTAWYRFLMDRGVRLDETILRAPVLLFGVLFLACAPVLVARRFGVPTGLLFGFLAAISPLLVFYSRIVRSYMPAVALSFLAALAFLHWLEGGRARWAVAYVVLGALAVWFHLLTGPIVALPLAFGAARWLTTAGKRRPARHLLLVASGLAAALLLLLLPAAASLREVLSHKVGETPLPGAEHWHALWLLFAGVASSPLAITFWLLAGLGLCVLLRQDRGVALYVLVLVAGHTIALLVVRPFGLDSSIVFVRYMLPALPWVLLCLARGLAALVAIPILPPRPRGLTMAAAGAYALALAVAGPLGDPALRRSSFVHSPTFLLFPCPRPQVPRDAVPRIYRKIAASASRGAIVEAPRATFIMPASLRAYEEVHGRRVELAGERFAHDPRLALRNTLSPSPQDLRRLDAGWILVHRDFAAEEAKLASRTCLGMVQPWPFAETALRTGPRDRHPLVAAAPILEAQLRSAWGPPDSDADGVVAWDLDRVRRENRTQSPLRRPRRRPA